MFSVSDKFKQYIAQPDRTFETKAEIDGVTYGGNQIVEFEIDDNLVPSDDFTMGAVISSQLILKIKTADTIFNNAKIVPFIRLSGSEGYTEWVPLGSYYIDSRSNTNNVWIFTCLDKLVVTNQTFISAFDYPTSMLSVLSEIAGQLGVEIDEGVEINPAYQIPYKDEDITMHDMLSYIAMAHGASVRLTKEEKLTFIRFQASAPVGTDIEANEYVKVIQTNPIKTYTRIVVTLSDEGDTWEAGTGDDAHTLNLYNPFMTQPMLNILFSQFNGFSYVPMKLDWRGRIYLEAGDKIAITNGTNLKWNTANITWKNADIPWGGFEQFYTVILNDKISFKGGLRVTSTAPGKSDQQSEFNYQGSLNKTLSTMVKQNTPYFGVTISKLKGLDIKKSDGSTEVIMNSDVLVFSVHGTPSFYYDVVAGKLKFIGDIEMQGGSISWANVGAPSAAQVGAKPYDWVPGVTDVSGLPDMLTYIDDHGIYTGTLTAQQINAIQGIMLGVGASIDWAEVNPPAAADIDGLPEKLTHIDEHGIYTGELTAEQVTAEILFGKLLQGVTIKAGKIIGDDDENIIYFGDDGSHINAVTNPSDPTEKSIRVSAAGGGYIQIMQNGTVFFYEPGSGTAYAYLSPNGVFYKGKRIPGVTISNQNPDISQMDEGDIWLKYS